MKRGRRQVHVVQRQIIGLEREATEPTRVAALPYLGESSAAYGQRVRVPRWASAAAATASRALANATKKESPCVSTSLPPEAAKASRIRRRCAASASA